MGLRKRARKYTRYYTIWHNESRLVQKVIETGSPFDDERFASGNYWLTRAEAQRQGAKENLEKRREQDRKYSRAQYESKKRRGDT